MRIDAIHMHRKGEGDENPLRAQFVQHGMLERELFWNTRSQMRMQQPQFTTAVQRPGDGPTIAMGSASARTTGRPSNTPHATTYRDIVHICQSCPLPAFNTNLGCMQRPGRHDNRRSRASVRPGSGNIDLFDLSIKHELDPRRRWYCAATFPF